MAFFTRPIASRFELTLQIFVEHLVSSVSYRTGNSYVCAVRSLHADMHSDLGQSNPLVATPRRVYMLRGIRQAQFRKSPSICLEFGHSESHGACSLFVVPRQLCQGYASLNGLAWLLMHERLSLPRPRSAPLPCCSPSRPSKPKLSAQKSGSFFREPTTCSVRRPAFSAFMCVPLSYSSPGSLAVTLVAIGRASCPFDCDYSHLPFIFASAQFSAYPPVIRRGMQRVRHHVLYPLRCLEPSSLSAGPFGVGFHSNRPSIDPSVGSPPSLRGHSTGALSLCIPAKPRLRRCVAEQTLTRSWTAVLQRMLLAVLADRNLSPLQLAHFFTLILLSFTEPTLLNITR